MVMEDRGKKILTVSIAAYNVEDCLAETLEPLIIDEEYGLEVLIINDGSTDETLALAKQYEKRYPNIFRVINKENGGYGSTINCGIEEASGKYFKQLDGDDSFITKNLKTLCRQLKKNDTDVVCTPYIERNVISGKETFQNTDFFERFDNRTLRLKEIDEKYSTVMRMHTLTYKTNLLKNNDIRIDENCFYTDVEYVLFPCLFAKTLKVLNLPIYLYSTGNDGQSMSKIGMLKHCDDHTKMSEHVMEKLSSMGENVAPLLKRYVVNVSLHDIIQFKVDIFPFGWCSYKKIKKCLMNIKRKYDKIYFDMLCISNGVKAIDRFGFLGYFFVKIFRGLKGKSF